MNDDHEGCVGEVNAGEWVRSDGEGDGSGVRT